MAATEPPSFNPPSRRLKRQSGPEEPTATRSERNRLRRERSMERRFTGIFVIAVGVTILYLVSKTPWGAALVRAHF